MCNFGVCSRFLDVIYGVRPPNGSPVFMLLKSQTSAIKYVFSFIPNQSNSEVGSPMFVYNTLLDFFLPLINGKSIAHLFQTII